jgi:hypothetical protein
MVEVCVEIAAILLGHEQLLVVPITLIDHSSNVQ